MPRVCFTVFLFRPPNIISAGRVAVDRNYLVHYIRPCFGLENEPYFTFRPIIQGREDERRTAAPLPRVRPGAARWNEENRTVRRRTSAPAKLPGP